MRRLQSGSAFMLALITMLVMTLVIASFSVRLDSHLKTETLRLERRKAELAVQAGLARAMAALALADVNVTSTEDEWYSLGNNGAEEFTVGESQFRVQILDTTRFVNLNVVNEEQLRQFNLTDEQIASLLDWRNTELQPRLQGAKDEYYNALETPYNVKLRGFDTVSELLLVKGFTPKTLFEPPSNLSGTALSTGNIEDQPPMAELITTDSTTANLRADGSARLNLNVASNAQMVQAGFRNQAAQAIIQRRQTQGQFTTLGQVFTVPGLNLQDAEVILNIGTVTGETFVTGKLNINTVSEEVLRTIPDMTEDQIQGIIGRQGTFEELGELAQVNGFSTNTLRDFADYFCIGSQTYLVRLKGRRNTAFTFLEAIVTVSDGQAKVIKMNRPIYRDPQLVWGWDADPTTTSTLMEAN